MNIKIVEEAKRLVTELLKQRDDIDKQISNANLVIELFSGNFNGQAAVTSPEPPSIQDIPYPHEGTWKDKIKWALKTANKVLLASEIIDVVSEQEDIMYSKKQVSTMVSGNLSIMAKKGIVVPYQPQKMRGFYYGHPSWFDSNKEIKEEYKPIMKQNILAW